MDAGQLQDVRQERYLSFDFETTGLDWRHPTVVGYSLASQNTQMFAAPSDVDPLIEAFSGRHILVGHNLAFDLHAATSLGITIRKDQLFIDTMVMAHVMNENQPLGLKYLAHTYLGVEVTTYQELLQLHKGTIPFEVLSEYGAKDARMTLDLFFYFVAQMSPREKNLYWYSEAPIHRIIFEMERRGILLDRKLCAVYLAEATAKVTALDAQAHSLLETANYKWVKHVSVKRSKDKVPYTVIVDKEMETNLASTHCLADILFSCYALPVIKTTAKTNRPQIDDAVLSTLASKAKGDAAAFISTIRELREQNKLIATYYEPLLELTSTGAPIQSDIHQTGTVTGRFSSSQP